MELTVPALGYKTFKIRHVGSKRDTEHTGGKHASGAESAVPGAPGNIAATFWQKDSGWEGCESSKRLKIQGNKLGVVVRPFKADAEGAWLGGVDIEMRLAQSCGDQGRCSGPYVLRSSFTNSFWVSRKYLKALRRNVQMS
jgi:hypothetical protein